MRFVDMSNVFKDHPEAIFGIIVIFISQAMKLWPTTHSRNTKNLETSSGF